MQKQNQQRSHVTGEPVKQTIFDLNMLKSRGIDPHVADYFSHAPRFAEGVRRVALQVNGNPRGSVDARFDSEGQLCFTQALLDQANLKVPEPPLIQDGCYDFIARFAQTEVTLRPNRQEVALIVPTDALRPRTDSVLSYQQGGVGGLINYDLLGMNSEYSGKSRRYYSANTELGFNAGDWLVRSRQMHSIQDQRRTSQTLYTYAQKTFVESESLLQVGEININNSVFPGAAITGVQVVPELALQNNSRSGTTVEGIAQSQARVEVRQAGALIYSTLVPAGPFSLPDIPLLNGNTDLDVRVIEANGEQRDFTIAAAALAPFAYTAPGYSFAVGKVRTFGAKDMESPTVVTGTGGWLITPANNLSAGLMLGQNNYQAVAWTLGSQLTPDTSTTLRSSVSKAGKENLNGAETSLSASTRLTETFSASASATRRTSGYRELMESTSAHSDRGLYSVGHDQYAVSLSWSDPWLGGFSTSYSTSTTTSGQKSEYLSGSWNKQFKQFSVSANIEKSMGRSQRSSDEQRVMNTASESNAVYLTVSVPLGGARSARSYATRRDGSTRFGAGYTDSSSDLASYSLSAERDAQAERNDFSGSVSLLPRFASVNLGYSQSGNDSTSYSGQLRGGVALHKQGITLSPYALNDTFAVASVGDVSGIKLNTPSGPVWTDPWGRAVVARLPAYQKSHVEVATKSLPRNLDIQNGYRSVAAGRGSVQALDFSVTRSRRALLRTTDSSGTVLPKGAAVFNAQGEFVTSVVDGGRAFIANENLEKPLTVRLPDNSSCALNFKLPKTPDPDVYFEKADALCSPN
ncbi:fimbrial biogenesis usher protein [Pseudomonas fontis]|uniref:Fimbrial biogenesis usher protein n=1 Tax=Pseudomonas fontis TaxID=2942633 RepID=A0ABT5NZ10_9PSED|nr:fimbrial biogenesis usher protein [Pseudomonas fontis]MDD0977578.1 fimbrial biogenesis usher protein [Pseudomonas fontis]MDD0993444.1 fimbrial biogenesis usher protein [Pseudomonas fontis]